MADATAESIRKRHIERQQKRIRQMKRRRMITMLVLISIVLLIIIFFTPLFNVRKLAFEGNVKVDAAQLEASLEKCVGTNIFRYRSGPAEKRMKEIPYIKDADIKKSPFSGKLTVSIIESTPAAYIEVGDKQIVLDSELKVLEVADKFDGDVPRIIDVSTLDIKPGKTLSLQTDDSFAALQTVVAAVAKENLLQGVEYISFKDLNNIMFNYQDRLDVVCGTTESFENKIKLFNQAMQTSTLTENSRGTINLSEPGRAVYTP